MLEIRNVKTKDLSILAKMYTGLYKSSILNENWSNDRSEALLDFFYKNQSDLFIVAEIDGKIIGAIMSLVKPWHDGNRLIETEVFVSTDYQKQGIGSRLFLEHFKLAMEKYDVKIIEAHTYEDEKGYPLKWYKKQGYTVIDEWYVINGNVKESYEYFRKNVKEI